MTAKHRDDDSTSAAPPCFVHEREVEKAVEHARQSKRIGELNGAWAVLLKLTLALFLPGLLGWQGWMMTEITAMRNKVGSLETNAAVQARMLDQIQVHTDTLSRHEKELSANAAAIIALTRELGTSEQRVRMYVTRNEWELRNETRDREMTENRTAHEAIMLKLDRLIERVGALKTP